MLKDVYYRRQSYVADEGACVCLLWANVVGGFYGRPCQSVSQLRRLNTDTINHWVISDRHHCQKTIVGVTLVLNELNILKRQRQAKITR